MQRAASRGIGIARSWPSATACLSNRSTLARHPLSVVVLPPRDRRHAFGKLAFVEDHVEYGLRSRIGREHRQAIDGERAQRAERIVVARPARQREHRLHRQLHALAECGERGRPCL